MFIVELILKRAEMAIVLDSLGLSTLIGMETDAFQMSDHEKRALASSGASGLIDRNLAERGDDGTLAIDGDLRAIVKVAADAELAVVILKDIPGLGKQLIVHAAMNNAVVEHTRPTGDSHRVAVLKAQTDLPERWAEILPLGDEPRNGRINSNLEIFPKIVSLANAGAFADAIRLFPGGTPRALADQLVKDMHSPTYSANIAFLWREQGLITDGRNLMLLVGENASWLIAQIQPGSPIIEINKVNREVCLLEMVEQWKSVAQHSS